MTEPAAASSPAIPVHDELLEVDEDFSEHFDAWVRGKKSIFINNCSSLIFVAV